MKDNVGVSIFGRAIPMEFDFEQIELVEQGPADTVLPRCQGRTTAPRPAGIVPPDGGHRRHSGPVRAQKR